MQKKIQDVRLHLIKLIKFYEPFRSLANAHFVTVLTRDLWNSCVPENIRKEINSKDKLEDFLKVYQEILKSGATGEFARKYPNLADYLNGVRALTVANDHRYTKSFKDFESLLPSNGSSVEPDLEFKGFMTEKKLHEVKVTSKLAAIISRLMNTSHVIDVGGGKGYLSWILTLNHGKKVLGVDASHIKCCGAIKRSENIALRTTCGIGLSGGTKETRRDFMRKHYKSVVHYVTPETDVRSLVREKFDEEPDKVILTGLHTCGNLAPTSLRLFVTQPDIASLVNVGCCYNLLTEEFPVDFDSNSVSDDHSMAKLEVGNFPMSEFLRKEKFALGHNARTLAAYSMDRLINEDLNEHTRILFYRAIFEIIASNKSNKNLRKLGKKCSSFYEYVAKAMRRIDVKVEVTEEYAKELYESHMNLKSLMMACFCIRVSLAPIIESIIVLDRFLYLLEQGVDNAYLLKLFDLSISPRGYALVAWKDISKT